MTEFWTWDAATWQTWAATNWPVIVLAAAGLILLLALGARASRPRPGYRPELHHGEFASAMPDRPLERGQVMPDRRADVLAAIDNDYATGRIDRVEWERRRRDLL